ncbi:calcium-binding protein, partial [Sphingomonas alpina]
NRLDGGLGADQMVGGLGNDIYVVDNIGDQIVELSGGGTDTIESSVSFSLGNAPEVENLTLTGTAPTSAQGNGLANILTGNAGANLLQGGDGNDILDGGTGADWMHGGQGNDQYYIDDINDYILEQVNEGLDSVYSSITYSLLLADGAVEDLTLIGSAAINGTGNVLNNRITGNAAVNILDGGQGNDTLDGGAGADLLYGGGSDDRYIVDNSMDRVIEFANEGTDLVESSVSFSFSNLAELENLTLTGSAAINGTGNASGNFLTGNSAANILDGGLGSDTLTGLGGADTFVFGTALGASNVDTITDFVHGTDR